VIVQASVAAGIAWLLARTILDEEQAMFAPIAAIVALLGSAVGARGKQVLVLMLGVGIGVLVGELLVGILKGGPGSVVLAAAAAMLLVSFVHDNSLSIIQAGIASWLLLPVTRGPARRASGERWPRYTCFAQITERRFRGRCRTDPAFPCLFGSLTGGSRRRCQP
jgi:hypothetical protein